VFSPFIVDATLTLFRRLIRGEKVWEAHKSHYYQRLVQLGWGHRRTVLWEYLLMLLCGASAIAATVISIVGFQLIMLSIIADMMNSNRKLNEDILYKLKKVSYK